MSEKQHEPIMALGVGVSGAFPLLRSRGSGLVRYRMHEANVQRAVKRARLKLGISVLPHVLRHGYATHCLDRGTSPRAIQQAMGHKSLERTMGYPNSALFWRVRFSATRRA
ncbi:MAG TPA: tyrosine-type recombinase/integrase [Verrucomicrobiae bacterium]|nr:tyrosine-type recombinase/integrase [Verrucomicrobiae bacterium]